MQSVFFGRLFINQEIFSIIDFFMIFRSVHKLREIYNLKSYQNFMKVQNFEFKYFWTFLMDNPKINLQFSFEFHRSWFSKKFSQTINLHFYWLDWPQTKSRLKSRNYFQFLFDHWRKQEGISNSNSIDNSENIIWSNESSSDDRQFPHKLKPIKLIDHGRMLVTSQHLSTIQQKISWKSYMQYNSTLKTFSINKLWRRRRHFRGHPHFQGRFQ